MFLVKRVSSQEELALQARTRFEVYCREKGWLDPEEYPDGLESDQYDVHSTHILAMSIGMTAECAGTMRLIYDADNPLPVEGLFDVVVPSGVKCGEISRLTVAQPYRNSEHALLLGLCRCIYDVIVEGEFEVVYAILEPPLLSLLSAVGFFFIQLSDPRPVWGGSTVACRCDIGEIITSLKEADERTNLNLSDYFTTPFSGIV